MSAIISRHCFNSLVLKELKFRALVCGNEGNPNYQSMSIAYSIKEPVNSDISKITASNNLSEEEKQRRIHNKYLYETNCCGYFFDQMPPMDFRHLYLETCNGTLDNYIRKRATQIGFRWTILQEMCCQLVESVAWLHQRKFSYNGQLHTRNIFVKTSDTQWKVKLQVPETPNPFHNLDVNYWSGIKQSGLAKSTEEKAIQEDLVSVVVLLYFIQSTGAHPFQITIPGEPVNNQTTLNQMEEGIFGPLEALDRECFCINENKTCENETQCKYRLWVNMLAKDHIRTMLTELFHENKSYTNESSEKLMEHPFFWKTSRVLSFIEKSSNYLNEAENESKKSLFCFLPRFHSVTNKRIRKTKSPSAAPPWQLDNVILLKLEKNHKNIFDYLHETPARNYQNTPSVPGTKSYNSLTIQNFFGLLKQIRNKSSHWNELTVCGPKAKEDLKKINFVADNEMDDLVKFCLFWNIHFPSLVLYTWKNLEDVIVLQ